MAPGSAITTVQRPTLSAQFAAKYGIDQSKVFAILKDTVLRPGKDTRPATDAEVAAFMVVCNNYELNPFIKEIFGFISKDKMQYVVSVDGWSTLINRQNQLNGIEFEERFRDEDKIRAITCKIHRKDRALPTVITEYFSECFQPGKDTWLKWPVRMLRHKALIQCARIAFGLAGIMDEDEAERMQGYPALPTHILEGNTGSQALDGYVPNEVKQWMDALKWPVAKRQHCLSNFGSDPEGLREYVRKEALKAGVAFADDGVTTDPGAEPERTVELTLAEDTQPGDSGGLPQPAEAAEVVQKLADLWKPEDESQAAPAKRGRGRKADW